jgi:hypothetical protein
MSLRRSRSAVTSWMVLPNRWAMTESGNFPSKSLSRADQARPFRLCRLGGMAIYPEPYEPSTLNFQPSTSSKGQAQNFIPLISPHLHKFAKIISACFCAFLDFL